MPNNSNFAPFGAERGSAPRLALMLLVASCSSTAVDDELSDPSGVAGGEFDDADDAGEGGQDEGGSEGTGGTRDPETDGGGTSDPGGDSGDSGASPLAATCSKPMPDGWVFCEDFETLSDPLESFSEYAAAEGAFTIDAAAGAMRAEYSEGLESAGWVLVAFGASPIVHSGGRTYAPKARFDEIYWRVRVKHERGWPDVGPGWLGRATAFATDDWAEAVVAQLRSAGPETTLEAVPYTCVAGGSVQCSGYNDQAKLENLEALQGKTELFSNELSGEWHCVEAHIRLNTPGAADGAFEFWVDGNPEAAREDVDWRGQWGDYGINAVTLENFWPGGATADLTRWMDDIVVSTTPIGCD